MTTLTLRSARSPASVFTCLDHAWPTRPGGSVNRRFGCASLPTSVTIDICLSRTSLESAATPRPPVGPASFDGFKPYKPPMDSSSVKSRCVTDDVNGRHPAAGRHSALLVAFVLFFSLGSWVARVESDAELVYVIIVDLLVGAAIVGIGVLNIPHIVKRTRLWTRMLPVVVLALVVSGFLISWQSYAYFMRKNAYRHFLEQQLYSSEAHE